MPQVYKDISFLLDLYLVRRSIFLVSLDTDSNTKNTSSTFFRYRTCWIALSEWINGRIDSRSRKQLIPFTLIRSILAAQSKILSAKTPRITSGLQPLFLSEMIRDQEASLFLTRGFFVPWYLGKKVPDTLGELAQLQLFLIDITLSHWFLGVIFISYAFTGWPWWSATTFC